MGNKNRWTRLVDSAQRRIVVEQPRTLGGVAYDALRFEIQGVVLIQGQREEMVRYYEMHDRGLEADLCKKLTLMDRLRRYPAAAGTQQQQVDQHVITLWTPKPFLQIVFRNDDEDDVALYEECRYMVLSAGFYLMKL